MVSRVFALAICAIAFAGCIFDGNEHPRIQEVIVEPSTVTAGDTVTVTVHTTHFTLVHDGDSGGEGDDDGEGEHEGDDDGEGHHGGGDANSGHFHIYLDNLLDNPLAMPHMQIFEIQIPEETAPGTHQLIVRLQHASHLIIEPQVISAAAITVE